MLKVVELSHEGLNVKVAPQLVTQVQVQIYLLLTSALEGGLRSMPRFTPGNRPLPLVQEAGLAPGPVRTGMEKRKSLDHTEDRTSNFPQGHESYRRSTNSLLF